MKILERMLRQQQFTPATVEEYIALQFAHRLKDQAAIKSYLHYVSDYPVNYLLSQLRKAKRHSDAARAFHSLLKQFPL